MLKQKEGYGMKLLTKYTEKEVDNYLSRTNIISYGISLFNTTLIIILMYMMFKLIHCEMELPLNRTFFIGTIFVLIILLFLDTYNRCKTRSNLKRLYRAYKLTNDDDVKRELLYNIMGYVIIHQMDELKEILDKNEEEKE